MNRFKNDGVILVTGGAGYIGSHVVKQLVNAGYSVIVLDNLSTGFAEAVIDAELIVGDVGDRKLVMELLATFNVETVMHFAAATIVPESVKTPIKYYSNNTCGTTNLLACASECGVRHFVFSSTAAVYGIPEQGICYEETDTRPINPYGWSKWMSEQMLRHLAESSELRYVILRYFNVAGCDSDGVIGQSTERSTLLTKVACEAAVGKRKHISIFGTDYPTPDGTGVRDYIHVDDLAAAHVAALEYLSDGGASETFNCGYGHGFSVREVINAVEKAAGKEIPVKEAPRRPGDPPTLIAACDRIQGVLGWSPTYDDLSYIAESSLRWEKHLEGTKAQ